MSTSTLACTSFSCSDRIPPLVLTLQDIPPFSLNTTIVITLPLYDLPHNMSFREISYEEVQAATRRLASGEPNILEERIINRIPEMTDGPAVYLRMRIMVLASELLKHAPERVPLLPQILVESDQAALRMRMVVCIKTKMRVLSLSERRIGC